MTTATIAMPMLPAISENTNAYVNAAVAAPILSEEEEKRLVSRIRDGNDADAERQLVMSHLRLVVALSRNYRGYGLNQGDLIQEGNIGLLKAVRRFNPAHGVRLAIFATYWIKAEIHEFIVRNWRMVKIVTTKAQRKLFFNKNRLSREGGIRAESNEAIAAALNVKPEEVEDMRMRIHSTDMLVLSPEEDETYCGYGNFPDDSIESNPEDMMIAQCDMDSLRQAMSVLKGRELNILTARWLREPPQTRGHLARMYGLSAERVRQIENSAMRKIAAEMKKMMVIKA